MNASRPYNRALLQAQDFDIDEFVQLTRDLPFSRLNQSLNEHLNEVKKELGQLVNDEFHQFIKLFSDIGETGTQEIDGLASRLDNIKAELDGAHTAVQDQFDVVRDLSLKLGAALKHHVSSN